MRSAGMRHSLAALALLALVAGTHALGAVMRPLSIQAQSQAQVEVLSSPSRSATVNSTYTPRWLTLPPTPKLPTGYKPARLEVKGASIWYATWYGLQPDAKSRRKARELPPVVFLHGGLASSTWWGNQIASLLSSRNIIAIDSRAQGRSTSFGPLGYDRMTHDVEAVLAKLGVKKAAFVGWSDGAIIILDLLLNNPSLIERGFSFAPNYDTSGVKDVSLSPVFTTYIARAKSIYEGINPQANYTLQQETIFNMWASQPSFTEAQFRDVKKQDGRRIWIVDGDHEEAVKRGQIDDLGSWIPDAAELILPGVSHFAFVQAPTLFTEAIRDFLDEEFD